MQQEVELLFRYSNDDIGKGTRSGLYKSSLSLPEANWKTKALQKGYHFFI